MTKVVLLESHPLMRLGLHQILNTLPGDWEVTAYDPRNIGNETPPDGPIDLLVFGLSEPLDRVWNSLKAAHTWLKPKKTLLVAEPSLPWTPPPHWLEGLYGCIPKTSPVEVLEAAIRLGMAGGQCFPALATEDGLITPAEPPRPIEAGQVLHNRRATDRPALTLPDNPKASPPATSCSNPKDTASAAGGASALNLTPRQFEVLKLLARGYPIKTVSRTLNISTATAKAHASTLYQRLHVNSKGKAVYAARQRGVLLD